MKKQKQLLFFKRLESLYSEMDAAWAETAEHYGFVCRGCLENCCESEFYHHSHIEKDYLLAGLSRMEPALRKAIRTLSKNVAQARHTALQQNRPLRIMCPANEEGLCQLYSFRPMICRLHGIPHELTSPGRPLLQSPGCNEGAPLFDRIGYLRFDRTPFYTRLAALEAEYRTFLKKAKRIKLTVADMISG